MSEIETPEVTELPKRSKLSRIKSNVVVAGIYIVPVAMFGGAMYVSTKNATLALETAKLNFETAKLNAQA